MVAEEPGPGVAGDVLRAAAGCGVLVLVLAAVLLGTSRAGNAGEAWLFALGVPPVAWAAWRPSWLSGAVATAAGWVPLAYALVGIVLLPALALATLWLGVRRLGALR